MYLLHFERPYKGKSGITWDGQAIWSGPGEPSPGNRVRDHEAGLRSEIDSGLACTWPRTGKLERRIKRLA